MGEVTTALPERRILIVDDAAIIRRILRAMFQKNGFAVAGEAQDGQEGLLLYRELRPDLVTMDITMPNKDGIVATREILTEFPDAKIIMVSSVGQENVIREAIGLGALDFIVKPLKEEQIISAVKRVLDL
ncbi:MAG: response regulator [Candidatus Riflebacteria bacterium]|nr:response regulator [Candidatus Riflebacteria bacterium]